MSDRVRYWRRQVSLLESSGLSRAEFCRRYRLSYHSMTYWLERLEELDSKVDSDEPQGVVPNGLSAGRRRALSCEPLSFVEVPLATMNEPTKYEVILGSNRRVRFADDFDQDALTRIIRAVESC